MRLISGDETGLIKVIDVTTGVIRRMGAVQSRQVGVDAMVWAGEASDHEAEIAVGHRDGTVKIYDVNGTDINATLTFPKKGPEVDKSKFVGLTVLNSSK